MKTILMMTICLFAVTSFAKTAAFDLKVELSIDGKPSTSAQIIVAAGQKGSVTQENDGQKNFIDVVAKEDKASNGKQAIFMDFVIGKIEKDGTKKILSTPKIIALPNEEAQITVGSSKPEVVFLKVTATKTTL